MSIEQNPSPDLTTMPTQQRHGMINAIKLWLQGKPGLTHDDVIKALKGDSVDNPWHDTSFVNPGYKGALELYNQAIGDLASGQELKKTRTMLDKNREDQSQPLTTVDQATHQGIVSTANTIIPLVMPKLDPKTATIMNTNLPILESDIVARYS
jgi:hypothetical protein